MTPHQSLKIDIGVGGRFHADRMARALSDAGHDVTLFTSFPASRFPDLSSVTVKSDLWPELVFRLARRAGRENSGDLYKMRMFGSWLARHAARRPANLFLGWSSFSRETLLAGHGTTRVVVRDSTHAVAQDEILRREFARLQLPFPDRSVCVRREKEEYDAADAIVVPSELARQSFLSQGVAAEKIAVLPLGVDIGTFRAPEGDLHPQGPLEVINFGLLSVRKGIPHLLEAVRDLSSKKLRLSLVGGVSPELKALLAEYRDVAHAAPLSQSALAARLRRAHVFVFPTLEDGYGLVLPQAMASGLVPIVTDRAGSASLVRDGENGFVVPAGNPAAIREKLLLLASDPALTARLRRAAARVDGLPSWETYRQTLLRHVGRWTGTSKERRHA